MTVSRHLNIHGRVQGVWFRAWAEQTATELGLVGWVRNRADGSVEAHVQGDGEAVERFIELAHEGSRNARVDRVEVGECERFEAASFRQIR
jgi:acylphosphatase